MPTTCSMVSLCAASKISPAVAIKSWMSTGPVSSASSVASSASHAADQSSSQSAAESRLTARRALHGGRPGTPGGALRGRSHTPVRGDRRDGDECECFMRARRTIGAKKVAQ